MCLFAVKPEQHTLLWAAGICVKQALGTTLSMRRGCLTDSCMMVGAVCCRCHAHLAIMQRDF